MTITLELWHIIPAVCVLAALWFFYIGSQEDGFLAGLLPNIAGVVLLAMAAMFLIGRWLA